MLPGEPRVDLKSWEHWPIGRGVKKYLQVVWQLPLPAPDNLARYAQTGDYGLRCGKTLGSQGSAYEVQRDIDGEGFFSPLTAPCPP